MWFHDGTGDALTHARPAANIPDAMNYERINIRKLAPYIPGEQPDDASVVKLNTNENPYPPAKQVIDAIGSIDAEQLRRYPNATAQSFRTVAATAHDVSPDQIIATNGGDELLRLAATVFCNPRVGDNETGGIGVGEPGYELYPVIAAIQDTPLRRIDLTNAFALPDDFEDQVVAGGCRLVIVTNPHAPSGRLEPLERLSALAQKLRGHAVLLIDEAYVDFSARDALPLVRGPDGLDNVLLLRSLSKGYSLAGLRFGYGLGHERLIEMLHRARDSYNTNTLSQVAATYALRHRNAAVQTWRAVIGQRRRLSDELTDRGFAVLPSETNFVLVTPPAAAHGLQAARLVQKLKQMGVYVRYFDRERLRDKIRITIGSPEQNEALLKAVDELMD